ncbi:hypothetical protein M422DRAFT_254556 [Sphaerobolus stellatus SS14]|uniref:Uncharacterized protein n=1 Tax=Sphaerobolus stellatus (strain SS14) TaxID=990650 RepID=A0A0C9VL84_SPHS4|nr:hypothetical protein M422DRAFT_254556 [Sphaerobolus stellatus SS14]
MSGEEVGGDVILRDEHRRPDLRVLVAPHVIRVPIFSAYFLPYLFFESFFGVLSLSTSSLHRVASRLSFVGVPSLPISSVDVLTGSCLSTSSFFFFRWYIRVRVLIALFVSLKLDNRAAAQDDSPSFPPQPHPKIKSSSNSNSKLTAMYQDIYTAPQAPHQQDTYNTNVGSSGNVNNATGARRGYPNMNVNVNGNGNGISGGGYQSQSQSPEALLLVMLEGSAG